MEATSADVLTSIVSFLTASGIAVYLAAGLIIGMLGSLIYTARKASK